MTANAVTVTAPSVSPAPLWRLTVPRPSGGSLTWAGVTTGQVVEGLGWLAGQEDDPQLRLRFDAVGELLAAGMAATAVLVAAFARLELVPVAAR